MPDGAELPWLYRIASYQVANHRRRLAIRSHALALFTLPDAAPAADAAFDGDPEPDVDRGGAVRAVGLVGAAHGEVVVAGERGLAQLHERVRIVAEGRAVGLPHLGGVLGELERGARRAE